MRYELTGFWLTVLLDGEDAPRNLFVGPFTAGEAGSLSNRLGQKYGKLSRARHVFERFGPEVAAAVAAESRRDLAECLPGTSGVIVDAPGSYVSESILNVIPDGAEATDAATAGMVIDLYHGRRFLVLEAKEEGGSAPHPLRHLGAMGGGDGYPDGRHVTVVEVDEQGRRLPGARPLKFPQCDHYGGSIGRVRVLGRMPITPGPGQESEGA